MSLTLLCDAGEATRAGTATGHYLLYRSPVDTGRSRHYFIQQR